MVEAAQRPNRGDFDAIISRIALALAGVWCVALLVGALTVPVYSRVSVSSAGLRSTTATLVGVNGMWALGVVALPLIPVAIVAGALWWRRRARRRGAGPVAWATVGLLGAFAFVTGFSIGLFVLPVVGLLAVACTMTHAPSRDDIAEAGTSNEVAHAGRLAQRKPPNRDKDTHLPRSEDR